MEAGRLQGAVGGRSPAASVCIHASPEAGWVSSGRGSEVLGSRRPRAPSACTWCSGHTGDPRAETTHWELFHSVDTCSLLPMAFPSCSLGWPGRVGGLGAQGAGWWGAGK